MVQQIRRGKDKWMEIPELPQLVRTLHPVHEAQLLSYLKLSGCKLRLLINFNVAHL